MLNEEGKAQEYFSLVEPEVYIQNAPNTSSFIVNYAVSGVMKNKTYILEECAKGFCGEFSMHDLFESSNGSVGVSENVVITIENTSKTVYLDVISPQIIINKSQVKNDTKKILFEFGVSDDNEKITNFSLYKKTGTNKEFVADLKGKTTYEYSVSNSGELTFVFEARDLTGNTKEKEIMVEVDDIFKPEIESFMIISYPNSDKKFSFKVRDENLASFVLSQDNLNLTGILSGDNEEENVNLPFSSGIMEFTIYDNAKNFISKDISLESKVTISSLKEYFKDEDYKFSTNANKCVLIAIDGEARNKQFKISSGKAEVETGINDDGEHKLDFYCEKDSYRQYFEKEFIFDTNPPTSTQLSVVANENGEIELEWEKSEDEESDVEYVLKRDGKKIYGGSKLEYSDDGVFYPEEYDYYVEVFDKAGNSVKSNSVSMQPKKVNIMYASSLSEVSNSSSENFTFKFTTEKGIYLKVQVKNTGQIVDEKIINETNSERQEFTVNLDEGYNEVNIFMKDDFGNEKEESYFVSFSEPVLSKQIMEEKVIEPVNANLIQNQTNQTNQSVILEETGSFGFGDFLILIFVILFVLGLIWILFGKNFKSNSKDSKTRVGKKDWGALALKRNKDKDLIKHREQLRKEREQRKKALDKEKIQQAKLESRERSLIEKKKYQDLGTRSYKGVDFSKKEGVKKKYATDPELSTLNKKKDEVPQKRSFFGGLFSRNKKPNYPKDSFSEYLQKTQHSRSWNEPREYYQSTIDAKLERQRQIQEQKELELKKTNEALKKQKEEQKRIFDEKKEREHEEKATKKGWFSKSKTDEKPKSKYSSDKLSLDDYLNKRTKKKRYFLAEKEVERDLKRE